MTTSIQQTQYSMQIPITAGVGIEGTPFVLPSGNRVDVEDANTQNEVNGFMYYNTGTDTGLPSIDHNIRVFVYDRWHSMQYSLISREDDQSSFVPAKEEQILSVDSTLSTWQTVYSMQILTSMGRNLYNHRTPFKLPFGEFSVVQPADENKINGFMYWTNDFGHYKVKAYVKNTWKTCLTVAAFVPPSKEEQILPTDSTLSTWQTVYSMQTPPTVGAGLANNQTPFVIPSGDRIDVEIPVNAKEGFMYYTPSGDPLYPDLHLRVYMPDPGGGLWQLFDFT